MGSALAGPPDLQALALELLAADEDALNTIPVLAPGLEGAPERAFVSPGIPSFDCCPQLTVHVRDIGDMDVSPGGLNAGKRNVTGKKIYVRLVTTIIRCVPDSRTGQILTTMPLTSDLEAAAEQTNADAWALYNHIFSMWRSGDFLSLCSNLVFEGAQSVGEQGKCAGWTMTLRAALDGYDDLETS
jgi:hypothetical protein